MQMTKLEAEKETSAPGTEIEITPAMIEAGVEALGDERINEYFCDPSDVAVHVFRSMLRAKAK